MKTTFNKEIRTLCAELGFSDPLRALRSFDDQADTASVDLVAFTTWLHCASERMLYVRLSTTNSTQGAQEVRYVVAESVFAAVEAAYDDLDQLCSFSKLTMPEEGKIVATAGNGDTYVFRATEKLAFGDQVRTRSPICWGGGVVEEFRANSLTPIVVRRSDGAKKSFRYEQLGKL